jgi:hypothetical protein
MNVQRTESRIIRLSHGDSTGISSDFQDIYLSTVLSLAINKLKFACADLVLFSGKHVFNARKKTYQFKFSMKAD